jgi:hypothetical protein
VGGGREDISTVERLEKRSLGVVGVGPGAKTGPVNGLLRRAPEGQLCGLGAVRLGRRDSGRRVGGFWMLCRPARAWW